MNDNSEAQCDSSSLNAAVDNVVQIFKNYAEEVQELDEKKWNLEAEIENFKKIKQQLELEKNEVEADITRLRLRNATYQKEHTNLRNAITVVRYQIEKIKEGIASAKANDLKALEDFEKAVDDITEKFRSGPVNYDRKRLLEKIESERAKKDVLTKKLEEVTTSHEDFCRAKGLRLRKDETEELVDCVLPDSALYCYIEMTKTLDEVMSECGIKNVTRNLQQSEINSESAGANKRTGSSARDERSEL